MGKCIGFGSLIRALGLSLGLAMVSAGAFGQAPLGDKSSWTGAEKKMDSALVELTRAAAEGKLQAQRMRELPGNVKEFAKQNVAADQTIFIVIRGDVSPHLTAFIKAHGGTDISEFAPFRTITARVPVAAINDIASRADVQTIGPREQATTNRYELSPKELKAYRERLESLKNLSPGAATNVGSVTWQGVTAHKANLAHAAGKTGTGVRVCVLSDGVNTLAARQATGDLPATVTVLPGQAGSGDEGTAMLEIVYDMAPGASLYFATGFGGSEASMATNIVALGAAPYSCNIIVDDVTYFREGAFQDGPIAQAVNTVTTGGALYFSSAANSGNLTHNRSGTYEGDFVASATPVPPAVQAFYGATPVQSHAFGGLNYTTLTAATTTVSLKWSDALGASGNDYDLVVTNAGGTTVLGSSGRNAQTGTQDPVEISQLGGAGFPVGSRLYVVKSTGAATRAIRLDTNRGRLPIGTGTAGSTFGHNAAANTVSVAAVNVATAGGGAFTGGAANPVEIYSSDGPRKMFYQPNGTAITPGNFLFGTSGGTTLNKVDMAAADCGSTSTPGFITFCGTSAAAPTAAAIAALIKGNNPALTRAQVLAAMNTTALDIEAPGFDRDSGVGIVMVPAFAATYTIGGTVSGLGAGKSVGLLNNGGDGVTVNANGGFTFATALASGAAYNVTVGTQPTGQTCSVTNGSGTVGAANITNVAVACVNNPPSTYTIGGTVSGLGAGKSVGLLNNGGDGVTVNANGGFTFATALASGAAYNVTVGTQPTGQTCSVTNGSGTVGAANITNVAVACIVTAITGPTSTGTGTATATLTGGGAACGFVTGGSGFVAQPAAPPAGVSFPHGFFRFTATSCPAANGGVTITVTYPSAIPPGAQYYKYGKEAGNTIDHYYTIPATVSGNQVTFTITDGQLGDNDLVANGTIIDPGAIGVPAAAGGPAVQPVPTLSQYALMALALGMFLMAARRRQGKRRR